MYFLLFAVRFRRFLKIGSVAYRGEAFFGKAFGRDKNSESL